MIDHAQSELIGLSNPRGATEQLPRMQRSEAQSGQDVRAIETRRWSTVANAVSGADGALGVSSDAKDEPKRGGNASRGSG